MAAYAFLRRNAFQFDASEIDVVATLLALAAGELGEEELAQWFEANSHP